MSLFSVKSERFPTIHPSKVSIDGEIVGSFYSGKIEMSYLNTTEFLESYDILIGQSSRSNICLHNFSIMLDNNPISLKLMKKEEAEQIFEQSEEENQVSVFGIGTDSYSSIQIPFVLPGQIVTVSSEFEMTISFPTKSTIEISFPLTYPCESSDDKILECDDFQFKCKFKSLPLKTNSITSNPKGKINLKKQTYQIDHLDPSLSRIFITYDLNPPNISDDLDNIRIQTNSSLFDQGIASYYGRYGSVTFIPTNNKNIEQSHFGEEFIFLVDCSGSMYGKEIELAAECLIFFIKSLPENCFFNVIRFGSTFVPLFQKPVPYTDENAQKAIELAFSLEADLGGTVLSKPLQSILNTKLSRSNKLRRVFVLTDGCVFDKNKVIEIVKQNASTTMCNAIGIGYGVDKDLVERIGNSGNGFVDFVLSGDDMRSIVIDQLSKSLTGFCNAEISIENTEDIEIVPPLSNLSPNKPVTFYFKSAHRIKDDAHLRIDIEGNPNPIILEMSSFPHGSRAKKSFRYLFNSENLKILRNSKQTKKVQKKITELSIEYGILCPYTAFVGIQNYSSNKEKERITSLIRKLRFMPVKKSKFSHIINVHFLTGKCFQLYAEMTDRIEDLKASIQDKEGTPPDQQQLIFSNQILEDGNTLKDYSVQKGSIIYVNLRRRGGGYVQKKTSIPGRTFSRTNDVDLVSIVAEQKIEGCWNSIPSYFEKLPDHEINNVIQMVQKWAKKKQFPRYTEKIVGTIVSLVYLTSYKKEFHKIWELVYKKALNWLISINKSINWDAIIKSL